MKTSRIKKENIKNIGAGDDVMKMYFFESSWERRVSCAAVMSV